MNIILYKAPNCLRCNIVKSYLEANGIPYGKFDLADDKDIVNRFYRDNRARLYRNPEGVEFPMFHETEGDVILQGTGVVLAWLLAGGALDACVTRSDLLHGWISGLYVSQCPDGQEDKFIELIRLLSGGGLQVCLQSDGRRADLLEKILSERLAARVILNIPGPAALYPQAVGGEAGAEFAADLKKSVELVKAHPDHVIRIWLTPIREADGSLRWITPAEAGSRENGGRRLRRHDAAHRHPVLRGSAQGHGSSRQSASLSFQGAQFPAQGRNHQGRGIKTPEAP